MPGVANTADGSSGAGPVVLAKSAGHPGWPAARSRNITTNAMLLILLRFGFDGYMNMPARATGAAGLGGGLAARVLRRPPQRAPRGERGYLPGPHHSILARAAPPVNITGHVRMALFDNFDVEQIMISRANAISFCSAEQRGGTRTLRGMGNEPGGP